MASRTEYRAIENILADPLIRAVMEADHVEAREMADLLRDVGRRLSAPPNGSANRSAKDVSQNEAAVRGGALGRNPAKPSGGYEPFAARSCATQGLPQAW